MPLRVVIESVDADGNRGTILGGILISKTDTGREELGSYAIEMTAYGRPSQTWRKGVLKFFPRKQRNGFDLVFCALRNMIGYRNPIVPYSNPEAAQQDGARP